MLINRGIGVDIGERKRRGDRMGLLKGDISNKVHNVDAMYCVELMYFPLFQSLYSRVWSYRLRVWHATR